MNSLTYWKLDLTTLGDNLSLWDSTRDYYHNQKVVYKGLVYIRTDKHGCVINLTPEEGSMYHEVKGKSPWWKFW